MIEKNCELTIDELFKRVFEIELTSAKVYIKLAELFSHVSEVSTFWDDLAKEEKHHEETLQEIYKSLTQEQLLSPTDKNIMLKTVEIQNLLNKDLINPIKNLDDAYELAHQLEYCEVESIFKFLVTKVVPSEKRKSFILSELNEHQKKLMVFSEKFGNASWRKQVTTRSGG